MELVENGTTYPHVGKNLKLFLNRTSKQLHNMKFN
jgi:hypothetical protein